MKTLTKNSAIYWLYIVDWSGQITNSVGCKGMGLKRNGNMTRDSANLGIIQVILRIRKKNGNGMAKKDHSLKLGCSNTMLKL